MSRLSFQNLGRKTGFGECSRESATTIAIRRGAKRTKRVNTYLSRAREVLSLAVCKVIDNAGCYPLRPLRVLSKIVVAAEYTGDSKP